MRMDTSPGPSVSGPLLSFRHLYYTLDLDFGNIDLLSQSAAGRNAILKK